LGLSANNDNTRIAIAIATTAATAAARDGSAAHMCVGNSSSDAATTAIAGHLVSHTKVGVGRRDRGRWEWY